MFKWQQKMNYETRWETVGEYQSKAEADKEKTAFKAGGVSHSGQSGTHFLQQRIIEE